MSTLSLLYEGNSEATIYCGNLDSRVTEEMIQELFIQAGPVINVFLPRDKISGEHQGFGFIEFKTEDDSDYAIKIMHMIKLFGKPIKLNKASSDKRTQDVGANIFVGNLDPDVDEKVLYDTFSVFGLIISTNIMRDPESGLSKGFAFIGYDNFEASDSAISSMNQQYFCNKLITVQYAYKKDTKGERHGTAAERLLAANRPNAMTKVNPSSFAQGGNQQTLHMNQNMGKNTGGISSSMLRNPPPVLFNQQPVQPQKQMVPPGMPQGMPQMPQGMPGIPMPGMPGMPGMPSMSLGMPLGMPNMTQGMPGMPGMPGMMPPMFPPIPGMMGPGGPMMPQMQGGFPPMPGMMGGMHLKPPGM